MTAKPVYMTRWLNDWQVRMFSAIEDDPGFWEIEVPSSRKNNEPHYVIRERDGSMVCSCPGYTYHQNCRHVNMVKVFIEQSFKE